MSAKDSTGEKTEKPTPKKLKESRKEGQVPRTPDLGGWGTLLAVALVLPLLVRWEGEKLLALFHDTFRLLEDPDPGKALTHLGDAATHAFLVLVVLGAGVMVLGVAGALVQGGFYLAYKSMKPSLKKLDPIEGTKRVFGPQALWQGLQTLGKSSVIALFAYGSVTAMMPYLGGLVPIPVMLDAVGEEAFATLRNVGVAGMVMAGLDYAMKRRRVMKQIKMSKHDVKQEHKQSDGDPLVKSAIRARQLATARNRMMADIPEADVVMVNPTHVAVALRYEAGKGAPTVVARGAGVIAAKIRETATEHDVPLVRDVPLARALYSATRVGDEIPAELFAAVAQVLAFVLSRRNRGQRGGEHGTPRQGPALPEVRPAGRRTPISSAQPVPGR